MTTAVPHVYFLRDAASNIKIGTSADVASRLKQLQTGSSGALEVVGVMPGGRDLEQALHASWSKHRLDGEWLSPAQEILEFVDLHTNRSAPVTSALGRRVPPQSGQRKRDVEFGRRVAGFLRRLHPSKTAVLVAADTGCSVDAVEKWLERASVPNGIAMLRLFLTYGPPFCCALIDDPPAWLDARRSAARQIELETGIARQRAELAALREGRP